MLFRSQQILMGFGRLAGAMYRLGISLRAYLPPERVNSLTDALYEELITPLEHEIADDLARLQEQAKHTATIQVDYSNPVQRTLRIFYPQALRILALAQNLDTLVCYLNPLWFARAITDAQYFALKEKYRNTLIEIARRIKNLATVQMEQVKAEVEAKEQAKAEAKQEGGGFMQDILFGTGRRQGMVEAMAKSAVRTMGSQLGRQILRGVLGGILGGRK